MVGQESLERLTGVLATAIGGTVSDLPRRQIAITSASVTSCAVIIPPDHPSREEIDDGAT